MWRQFIYGVDRRVQRLIFKGISSTRGTPLTRISSAARSRGEVDARGPERHGDFPARYTGPQSFKPTAEHTLSRVLTLYTGLRLGHGWEAVVDVESAGGRGLSEAFGLGGFTDLDVVRK